MGLFNDFKRCDGFSGSVPQKFYDANIPTCPLCGSKNPYWTLRNKMEMTSTRVQCKCKDCGGILSATIDDFSGQTKSKARAVLTTGGMVNALVKKHQGKDVTTVYVRIDDLGTSNASKDLLSKDLPIEQIQAMGNAFDMLR